MESVLLRLSVAWNGLGVLVSRRGTTKRKCSQGDLFGYSAVSRYGISFTEKVGNWDRLGISLGKRLGLRWENS